MKLETVVRIAIVVVLSALFSISTIIYNELDGKRKEVKQLRAEINELEQTQESISNKNVAHKNYKIQTIKDYILLNYSSVPEEVSDIIANSVVDASGEYAVDYRLIVGVIEIESFFNPMAKSKAGARGLMQIIFGVWSNKFNLSTERKLHDIKLNINIGTAILRYYINSNNNSVTKALQAYNGGGDGYADKVYSSVGKFLVFSTNRD